MQKVLLIGLFVALFFTLSSSAIFAADEPTLSDLVLSDLAVRNYLNNVSISLFDGKNDKNLINLNQDRHWLPASTVKTFAAMYAFDQISKGKLNLNSQYKIESVNDVPTEFTTPEFPELIAGEFVSLDRLIRQMITQSDNTAFNVMLDILGRKNITNYIRSIGLIHSAVGSKLNLDNIQEQSEFDIPGYGINTTTAEDYSKAFILLKNKKIPGANNLYSILKNQKINNMLPLFLPKTVTVAHKHGDLDPLFHDGGIVSSGNVSYVLSIFTNLGDPGIVAHISHLIYTKDLSLVGSKIKSISELPNNYIDPLMLSQTLSETNVLALNEANVLAATTQNIESFPITASDLGIKASDVLLSQSKQSLPSIPSDSLFSFAQPILQTVLEELNPTESISESLNQAKKLIAQDKINEAAEILKDIEPKLSEAVKSEDMTDVQKQSEVEGISNTRFALLGETLGKAKDLEAKKRLIKIIASAAKSEISEIQPIVPKAITSSNLSQKPLLGEIVEVRNDAVVVRSAGGQIVEIPSDISVKSRAITETKTKDIKITELEVGTSVALLGNSSGTKFIPSFALTRLDRQLIAPVPVNVLKVDDKNKVIVVLENGNLVQANINPQTIIKGSGTNVSLDSIKPGDVVIIRGEKLSVPKGKSEQEKVNPQQPQQPSSQIPAPSNNNQIPSQGSGPRIIQSTSIQVIEKKQDVKAEPKQEVKKETPKNNPEPPKPSKQKKEETKKK